MMEDYTQNNSPFAIRGNLDGDVEQEYTEKEQFIGLIIGREEFYLPIAIVNEIIMLPPITYVPQGPEFIEGVFNLRGRIIPAINLRRMFGLPQGNVTPAARIIIVLNNSLVFGLIVDAITYVNSLLPSEIEAQSLPGKANGPDLISRISKSGEQVIGILDMNKVITIAGDGKVSFDTAAAEE